MQRNRVYGRKGPEAKNVPFSVPITSAMHDRLISGADRNGLYKTDYARRLIEQGLTMDEEGVPTQVSEEVAAEGVVEGEPAPHTEIWRARFGIET